MDAQTGNLSVVPAWKFLFDDDVYFDEVQDEAHQTLTVSAENMAKLRRAYPIYCMDVRVFLNILKDLFAGYRTQPSGRAIINKLDLSFLQPMKKTL